MNNKQKTGGMDRRSFLKNLGGSALSVGFLQGSTFATGMMMARAAQAQNVPGIKRVICVYIPDGAPVIGSNLWLPSTDLILPQTTQPLESVKQHCIFMKNAVITNSEGAQNGGHGNTSKAFGGDGMSNTFDVEMERTIGANSQYPALLLGVQSYGHGSATKKNGSEINYEDNPTAAFDRVFNSGISAGGTVGTQRAQSIMDIHKAEINTLQSVLGQAEKERLEEHLASVDKIKSRIEQQASANVSAECKDPAWNTDGFVYDSADKTRFTLEANLQVDTAVMALSCNMTNVVSIMFGNHQSEHAIPELNFTGDYHQSIHGGQGDYPETRTYLSTRLAYLIEQLSAAKDELGNSLLDSTLIIQSTDMGDGSAHSSDLAPIMMAGGGSALNGGSVVECGSHMNVFDTATEIFGLTGTVPQFGTGALSGVVA